MSEQTTKIREARLKVWEQARGFLKDAETRDGGLSGELKVSYDNAMADFRAKTTELEAREEADAIEARMAAPQNVTIGGDAGEKRDGTDKREVEARERAFNAYLRHGMQGMTTEERQAMNAVKVTGSEARDLTTATGSSGGFTIPQGFLQKITERLKYFGPMRQLSSVITTESGQALPWPNNDDTGVVGSVLAENSTIAEADAAFTSKTLGAKVWTSGLVKAPLALLNDSAFDLETWLAKKFGQRLGRGQNTAFSQASGTSVTQGLPQGLVANGAPTITSATAGGLLYAYADLVNLKHKLDPAYRPGSVWMMNDASLAALQLLTDSTGRPLFFPAGSFGSISEGQTDTILGQPLYINNDLPVPASGASCTIIYGDISAAYIIRDVLGIQTVRLGERYMDSLEVGFFAFQRTDAIVDDTFAAAYLVNHA